MVVLGTDFSKTARHNVQPSAVTEQRTDSGME